MKTECSQEQKNPRTHFWDITVVLKVFEKSNNQPENCQFLIKIFMKTANSLRFLEITQIKD
jgi:hypothetical protein